MPGFEIYSLRNNRSIALHALLFVELHSVCTKKISDPNFYIFDLWYIFFNSRIILFLTIFTGNLKHIY